MEKKSFWANVLGHFINVLWSALWSVLGTAFLNFVIPKFFDITHEIMSFLSVVLAVLIFVIIWLLNYKDTKDFINHFDEKELS